MLAKKNSPNKNKSNKNDTQRLNIDTLLPFCNETLSIASLLGKNFKNKVPTK